MKIERLKIEKLLAGVFDELQKIDDPEEHAHRKQDFVFHMIDWKDDLEKLSELYTNPENDGVDASKIIVGFLYHVIPHLNVAGSLLLDTIPDSFEEKV